MDSWALGNGWVVCFSWIPCTDVLFHCACTDSYFRFDCLSFVLCYDAVFSSGDALIRELPAHEMNRFAKATISCERGKPNYGEAFV